MYFGSNVMGGQPGITLTGSSNLPSANQGQYSWIQVLTTYDWRYINAQGRYVCPLDASPEGDGGITPGSTFSDNPWVFATLDLGESAVSFKAKAYLMDAECSLRVHWLGLYHPGSFGHAELVLDRGRHQHAAEPT
jgi:hypothetical protein